MADKYKLIIHFFVICDETKACEIVRASLVVLGLPDDLQIQVNMALASGDKLSDLAYLINETSLYELVEHHADTIGEVMYVFEDDQKLLSQIGKGCTIGKVGIYEISKVEPLN